MFMRVAAALLDKRDLINTGIDESAQMLALECWFLKEGKPIVQAAVNAARA